MTQTEIYEFLKQGSLIRLPSGKLRIWRGGFEPVDFKKTSKFSIAYQNYFSTHLEAFQSSENVLETESSEFRNQLMGFIEGNPAPNGFLRSDFKEPSKNLYQDAFQVVQGKIHRGEIEKAVPIVFSENKNRPGLTDLARMLLSLLECPKELFVYGLWNSDGGILGATPEVLFHKQENMVQTMALAGTAKKTELSHADDLLRDPKEIREHQFVVEDLQRQLSPMGWVKTLPTKVV
jgi:isochorismate synthase EntC